jgi:hypothetical protein
VTAGMDMNDLDQQLAKLGYRGVDRVPVCWQVVQIGGSKLKRRVYHIPRPRPIGRSYNLYMLILRMTDSAPDAYRVTRIAG